LNLQKQRIKMRSVLLRSNKIKYTDEKHEF